MCWFGHCIAGFLKGIGAGTGACDNGDEGLLYVDLDDDDDDYNDNDDDDYDDAKEEKEKRFVGNFFYNFVHFKNGTAG